MSRDPIIQASEIDDIKFRRDAALQIYVALKHGWSGPDDKKIERAIELADQLLATLLTREGR